jgi:hypothetical protein
MQQNLYFLLHFFYFEINRYHDEFYWIKTHLLKKLFSRYIWDFPYRKESVPHSMTDLLQKLQNGFGKTKSAQRQSIGKHTSILKN